MKELTLQEIGKIVRKVRKERGLRLEDIADNNISPATVSNIERGIAHVRPEKISYLLKKLHLSENQLPAILFREQRESRKLTFTLLMISALIECKHDDEALAQLNELQLKENNPFIAQVYYYKGRCLLNKKKWKQAERAFYQSLRYIKQHSKALKEMNTEAACYLYLGRSKFKQKHFEQALSYFERGLKLFDDHGRQQNLKYKLYLNKIECYKKLHRVTEGSQFLDQIWGSIHNNDDIETTIHFYALRSEFAQKAGLIDDAIHFAEVGIDLASRNKQHNLLINLWIILGNTYMMCGDWELSERCFQRVIQKENDLPIREKSLSYFQLGLLYMKQNQLQKAYQSLQTALNHFESIEHSKQLSLCLLVMGDLCYIMARHNEAFSYFQKGQQMSSANGLKKREVQFWLRLARHWESKNKEKFQECIENIYRLQKEQPSTIDEYVHF